MELHKKYIILSEQKLGSFVVVASYDLLGQAVSRFLIEENKGSKNKKLYLVKQMDWDINEKD